MRGPGARASREGRGGNDPRAREGGVLEGKSGSEGPPGHMGGPGRREGRDRVGGVEAPLQDEVSAKARDVELPAEEQDTEADDDEESAAEQDMEADVDEGPLPAAPAEDDVPLAQVGSTGFATCSQITASTPDLLRRPTEEWAGGVIVQVCTPKYNIIFI